MIFFVNFLKPQLNYNYYVKEHYVVFQNLSSCFQRYRFILVSRRENFLISCHNYVKIKHSFPKSLLSFKGIISFWFLVDSWSTMIKYFFVNFSCDDESKHKLKLSKVYFMLFDFLVEIFTMMFFVNFFHYLSTIEKYFCFCKNFSRNETKKVFSISTCNLSQVKYDKHYNNCVCYNPMHLTNTKNNHKQSSSLMIDHFIFHDVFVVVFRDYIHPGL